MSQSDIDSSVPSLATASLWFQVAHPASTAAKQTATTQLLAAIKTNEMAPLLALLSSSPLLLLPADPTLHASLASLNTSQLTVLDDKIKDAIANLGETEISDAHIAKAQYYAKIGDKVNAESAYRLAFEKTVPLGHRIDLVFALIRLGIFFQDDDLIVRNIDKAKGLISQGGDWDRRNRLKVYEGIYKISVRDFSGASDLLLDSTATFTSTELMEYKEFVRYTVIAASLTLKRPDYKKKIVNAPEILEVIHEIPHLGDFMNALYGCKYAQFFKSLANIEGQLKFDRYIGPHYQYYVREMRIAAYAQLLESYQSVTIESMANSFGVSEDMIDSDLSKYIAAGRLNAVIDRVGGVIETNRPDFKNAQYQSVIKQGDLLLNRLQKLSRVINV